MANRGAQAACSVLVLAVLAVAAGCGSSDDTVADQNGGNGSAAPDDDSTSGGDTGEDGGGEDGGGEDGGDTGDGQNVTSPEVGSFIQGTAVAGNSGGDDPDEQTGEVLREEQRCFGHTPEGATVWTSGLEEGASVTILDATTGEAVGSGSVTGTSATQLESDPDDPMPIWECYFEISATVSRVPESFAVQVADLPPWPATFDSSTSRFVVDVTVPGGGETEATTPASAPVSTVPPSVSTLSQSSVSSPEVVTSTTAIVDY